MIASFRRRLLLLSAVLAAGSVQAEPAANWKPAGKSSGLEFFSQPRAGSSIQELKAIGVINAPPQAVQNVLDDRAAYPSFMPYVRECRVISHTGSALIVYQHLTPPLVSERDYTLRLEKETKPGPGGTIFHSQWTAANALGPAEKPGVMRVKTNDGSWLLEPSGADATRATYRVYTDGGGSLPAFIANRANQAAVVKVFDAIRKQVKDPKYRLQP